MVKYFRLILFFILILTVHTQALSKSSSELIYDLCNSSNDIENQYCDFYLMGATQKMRLYNAVLKAKDVKGIEIICLPEKPSNPGPLRLRAMYIEFIESNKNFLLFESDIVHHQMMQEEYACPE